MDIDIDTDKIDEAVLALLTLTRCDDKFGARAWKSHDWDALNRLHEKGYIGDPVSKAKSVTLTEEGMSRIQNVRIVPPTAWADRLLAPSGRRWMSLCQYDG